jgi:hypothetical protein
MFKCPKCGRFVGNIRFIENGLHDIKNILADCKTHGEVSVYNQPWDYEDVHGFSEDECEAGRQSDGE